MGESSDWDRLSAFGIAYGRITFPGIAHTGVFAVAVAYPAASAYDYDYD
jgi:hypothetical protein